jgi:hypothetical protein
MTDRIEPALTAEEWAKRVGVYGWDYGSGFIVDRPHAIIAVLNAALPDADPRKITRKHIAMLREAGRQRDSLSPPYLDITLDDAAELLAFADALESYLPPASPS